MMRLFIIANPQAGRRHAQNVIDSIRQTYPELVLYPFFTQYRNDEYRIVQSILKDFQANSDRLLILGGDGTLSKTLSCLPPDLPFSYFPTGSGNDFARSLGLTDLENTLNHLLSDPAKEIYVLNSSLGTVVNSLDVGYTAQVVAYSEPSRLKKYLNKLHLGKLTYLCFGVLSLFRQSTVDVKVQVDGQGIRLENLFLLSVANNTYFGGGIMIWPDSTAYRQQIDLVWIKNGHFFHRVRALLDLLFKRHRQSSYLYHLSCQEVVIELAEKTSVQLDGELTQTSQIELSCQKRYLY